MAEMVKISQPGVVPAAGVEKSAPLRTDNGGSSDKFERLAKETKEITTLYNLAVAVGSTLELPQVIWRLYKESARIVNATNFAVAIYDEEAEILNFRLTIHRGEPIKPFAIKPSNPQGVISRIFTKQTPLLLREIKAAARNALEIESFVPGLTVRSWLGVPILNPAVAEQSTQGIIALWSDQPNVFTDHDLWLLSAIATQAAIAIRNAQLFEASQRRATEMSLLHQLSQRRATEMALLHNIARTLSSTLEFNEVLTRVQESVNEILKVETGALFLTDALTGDLLFQVALGDLAGEIKPFRLPRDTGVAGQVASIGKPVLLTEVKPDTPEVAELAQPLSRPMRGLLAVPLILHQQVIGVLEVINKKDEDFTQNDLEVLSSIASYAAIAIENSRLLQNVLAKRDQVIEAEEQARRQLARDLHDGPTQLISSVMMRLDFCKLLLQREPAKLPQEIANTQKLADQAIHEIRTLLFEMRPLVLEAQGLDGALRIFVERRQKDVEGKTRLTLEIKTPNTNGHLSRQDDKVEAAIFAIVQEAVNNALKHAQAQRIEVQLKETIAAMYVIINDDGVGFDMDAVMSNYQQRGSLGMVNIRERTQLIGAELTMKSTPGAGTRITVYVPKAKEERMRKRGTGPLSLPLDMWQNGDV